MDFSEALNELKNGNKMTRGIWKDSGDFIYTISYRENGQIVTHLNKFEAQTGNTEIEISLKSEDLLADDWGVSHNG